MDFLITVETFSSRMEATIAKSVLEAHGIHAIVYSDDAGGNYPLLAAASGVQLKVSVKHLREAKRLLRIDV